MYNEGYYSRAKYALVVLFKNKLYDTLKRYALTFLFSFSGLFGIPTKPNAAAEAATGFAKLAKILVFYFCLKSYN